MHKRHLLLPFQPQKKRQRHSKKEDEEYDGTHQRLMELSLVERAMEVVPFVSAPSASSSVLLSNMPDEILVAIIEFLPLKSLATLAQVCRRFFSLARDLHVLRRKFPVLQLTEPQVSKKSKVCPEPSLCHTAVVWGDKMWVHGGHNTIPNTQLFDNVKKDFHYFDFEKNTWRKVKARNSPRKTEHSCVPFGDKLYMFGGYNGCEFTNSLYSYDFMKKKWKEVPTFGDVPTPRSAHVGGIYNQKMYIFGGWNGKFQNNDFYEFDFETSTWTKIVPGENEAAPSPRCSHGGVIVPRLNKFFIFGGCGGSPVNYNNELWAFDFETKKWSMTPTPLSPRSRMKIVEWNESLFIYGGWNRKEHFSDLHEFDINQNRWRCVSGPDFPTGLEASREQYSLVVHNNLIYVFGGFIAATNSSSNLLSSVRLWFPEGTGVRYPHHQQIQTF